MAQHLDADLSSLVERIRRLNAESRDHINQHLTRMRQIATQSDITTTCTHAIRGEIAAKSYVPTSQARFPSIESALSHVKQRQRLRPAPDLHMKKNQKKQVMDTVVVSTVEPEIAAKDPVTPGIPVNSSSKPAESKNTITAMPSHTPPLSVPPLSVSPPEV